MTKCSKCGKEMDDLEVKLEACYEDGKVVCQKCCGKKSPPKKEKKKDEENDDDTISPLGEDGKKNKSETSLTDWNKNKIIYWVLGIGAIILVASSLIGYFWWKSSKSKKENDDNE